jgi:hypothetical protein
MAIKPPPKPGFTDHKNSVLDGALCRQFGWLLIPRKWLNSTKMAEISHFSFRNFFAPPAFQSVEDLKGFPDPNEVIGTGSGR